MSGLQLLELYQFAVAEPLLRECLAIREKQMPDSRLTFNTQSLLGGSLLGQKKYADAEPLLLKGYEGMKPREKAIPPPSDSRIPETLDRLIELYSATNKPDAVKKYQELRAKYPKEQAPKPQQEKVKIIDVQSRGLRHEREQQVAESSSTICESQIGKSDKRSERKHPGGCSTTANSDVTGGGVRGIQSSLCLTSQNFSKPLRLVIARRRPSCCRLFTTSCENSRLHGWPRNRPTTPSTPPPSFTKRTCG